MNKFLSLLTLSIFSACNAVTTSSEKTVDSLKQVVIDSLKENNKNASAVMQSNRKEIDAGKVLTDTLKKNK